jgi:MFS family permease
VAALRKSVIQDIKEGLKYFVSQKNIRFSAGVLFVLSSALGAVSVVSIAFIQNTLHSATKDLGILIMFLGLGLFAGTLLYGRFGQRVSDYKAISISLSLSGLMLMAFAAGLEHYPSLWAAAGLSLGLGFFVSPIMIVSNTIVHKASDNHMRGKIFSSLEAVMHLGFLIFMYVSSILAERFPQGAIIVIIGIVFCALGALSYFYHRKIPWLD